MTRVELLRLQRNSKRYVFLREAGFITLEEKRIDELMRKFYEYQRKPKERACATCGRKQLHWETLGSARHYRLVGRTGKMHVCQTIDSGHFQPRIVGAKK